MAVFVIANKVWTLSLWQADKPLPINGSWEDTGNKFSLYNHEEKEAITGPLHFCSNIDSLYRVAKFYNTVRGARQALINEMVIEGMVYANPEKDESVLNTEGGGS